MRPLSPPSVSIIVLTYDNLADTIACITSLLRHTPTGTDILVLDNGSREDEATRLGALFPDRIRTVRIAQNRGFAGGCNEGARLASGDILVFLNNDTEVTDGWLQPLVAALDNPAIGACQPKLRSWHDRSRFDAAGAAGGFIDGWGIPYARGRVLWRTEDDIGQYDDRVPLDWACGAVLAVRRDDFWSVGGFDERYYLYMEEIDLCWTLRLRGLSIVCVSDAIVYHKSGGSWGGIPHRILRLKHGNNIIMLLKHLPYHTLIWLLPLRAILDAGASVLYAYQSGMRGCIAPLLGWCHALRLAPDILRTRRADEIGSLGRNPMLPQFF